jgi:PHD-finger
MSNDMFNQENETNSLHSFGKETLADAKEEGDDSAAHIDETGDNIHNGPYQRKRSRAKKYKEDEETTAVPRMKKRKSKYGSYMPDDNDSNDENSNDESRRSSSVFERSQPSNTTVPSTRPSDDSFPVSLEIGTSWKTPELRKLIVDASSVTLVALGCRDPGAATERILGHVVDKLSHYSSDIQPAPRLPPALEKLLGFFMKSLAYLSRRLDLAAAWTATVLSSRITALQSPQGSIARQRWITLATEELAKAIQYGIRSNVRLELEMELFEIAKWSETAKALLRGNIISVGSSQKVENSSHSMKLDALRDFVELGEKFPCDFSEMLELKAELRRGKNWLKRYHRTGLATGQAVSVIIKEASEDIQNLIDEASGSKHTGDSSVSRRLLCIDVRDELEVLLQATRRYCLCRQFYHGCMVGCDECDEWYHFQCVGLTQLQAEKVDKYVCIRCSLKNSFKQAAVLAAETTNKWSSSEDVSRSREAKKMKVIVSVVFKLAFSPLSHWLSFTPNVATRSQGVF